jgi:molybdopterin-guanine dinucleotide biosynthesis protein A
MNAPLAVILAGGAARRFGRDKALEPIAGRRCLERVHDAARAAGLETLVLGRVPTADDAWRGLADARPGEGPLAALAQAVELAAGREVVLLACDLPCLTSDLLAWLLARPLGVEGCLPRDAAGRDEPCCARYRPAVAPRLAAALARGERALHRCLRDAALSRPVVPAALAQQLHNLNTPDDLAALQDQP